MTNQKDTKDEVVAPGIEIVNSNTTAEGINLEQINSLNEVIKRIHAEADFAAKSFDGKSVEFSVTLNKLMSSFQDLLKEYDFLIKSHKRQIQINQEGLSGLTLIPEKLQNRIENIAPQIATEVEKIHNQRLETIADHFAGLQQSIKDSIIQNQKAIEETTKQSIMHVREAQISSLESQKKQIADFAQYVKKEVEAVTSNHGSKFLRNLGITLVLATVSGGLTSWYINSYFPASVYINKPGDIQVQHSAVKIWEADHPKISESNQKTKVAK